MSVSFAISIHLKKIGKFYEIQNNLLHHLIAYKNTIYERFFDDIFKADIMLFSQRTHSMIHLYLVYLTINPISCVSGKVLVTVPIDRAKIQPSLNPNNEQSDNDFH